jgi:hypothetical protein
LSKQLLEVSSGIETLAVSIVAWQAPYRMVIAVLRSRYSGNFAGKIGAGLSFKFSK